MKLAVSGFARRNSSIADCCDLKYSSRRYWPRSSAKKAATKPRRRTATSSRRRDMVRAASGGAREGARPGARPHGLLHFVTRTGSDADPQAPDLRDQVHGQDGEALAQFRIRACGPAQAPENLVRTLHFGVAHPFRVGAAAACAGIRAADFGFHVAPQGHVLQDGLIEAFEFRRIDIEPVEVAVEDERRALPSREVDNRLEREGIAVEPADDVERLRLEVRGPREDRGRVAVVAWAWPAGV